MVKATENHSMCQTDSDLRSLKHKASKLLHETCDIEMLQMFNYIDYHYFVVVLVR